MVTPVVTPDEAAGRLRSAKPVQTRLSLRRSDSLLGYFLVAPVITCILLLIIYPLFFAIYISFTDRVIGSQGNFVGLANYVYLVQQPSFQATVTNTVVMVCAIQAIKLVLGLGIAALLNQRIR